jgi:tetratricopeptide (TPR) repeat protein
MRTSTLLAAAAVGYFLAACGSDAERRAEESRGAFAQALERADRPAALEAIEGLRASLPDAADSILEIALLQIRAGDAPRAAWDLEDAVRRFPESDELRLALARVALRLGNPSLAQQVLAPISAESDQHAHALIARSQAELNLGDLERALATLAEAERRYPERPEARLVRIATLLSEHRDSEAREAIEAASLALEGVDEQEEIRHRLEVTLAQVQAQQGETASAIEALKAMVEANAADTLAWQALVQILGQQERRDEALELVVEALETARPPLDLYPIAAQLHAFLGDDEAALVALRTYVARHDSAATYLPLVIFHSNRDDAQATGAVLIEAIGRFPDEATLHLLYTETLLAQQRLDDAGAAFGRFRELTFDGDPQIDYLRARIELASGHANAAAKRLTKLAPSLDRAPTQFWLGRSLETSGDTEGARRRYGLARQRDRNWIAPTAALIALEQRRGDWRAVAGHARDAVRRAPQRLEGWIALVDALDNLDEGEAAEKAANGCLERFPDRAEPHLLLAKALRAQGRYDEALDAIKRAGDAPELAIQRAAERAITLGIAGRIEAGVAVVREALSRAPDAPELHAAEAALLYAASAAEQGARATDRALALDPEQPRPLRVRCEFRASTGAWSAARDDCSRYLAARPDDAGAQFLLGVILQSSGEPRPAAEAYRRAAVLDERDARPRNNLAGLLASEGDLDAALAAAQDAYRLDEQNPYVMDTLGELYLRRGLVERATSLLEEAHRAAPALPDATLHLALAYRDSGRTREARALLTDLKRNHGENESLDTQIEEALHSLR